MGWLRRVDNWLDLDRLPGSCLLCALPTRGDLCPGCRADLPELRHACDRCALPLPRPGTCGHCLRRPPPYHRAFAAFRYAPPLRDLVLRLKFRNRLTLARLLGELLAERIAEASLPRPDLILPVPLHEARLRERGYNQALELARPVARRLALPLDPTLALRRLATASQSDLPLPARRRNVRGAFAIAARPLPRHIAILDDVVTSGSTVRELTSALLRAGAGEIQVWSLARAG